jgi:hypothetical protein
MPVYTVHAPVADGTDARPATDGFVFVRDGFHFWAFVLGPLWLAWHRLWLALIGYVAIWVGVAVALSLLHAGPGTRFIVMLLIAWPPPRDIPSQAFSRPPSSPHSDIIGLFPQPGASR